MVGPMSHVADIALLLEGTYPFVRGGVSSWVHQIISGLPELRFAVIFIGGEPDMYGKPQYQFPANVTHFETHYLLDSKRYAAKSRPGNKKAFDEIAELHEQMRGTEAMPAEAMMRAFRQLGAKHGVSHEDFLYSEASWNYITEQYRERCTEPSFVDYFWAIRTMHAPLFVLTEIANKLPNVKALHAISTGYAGLLGAMIRLQRKTPFILTEHGIYTKERKIDLAQATWIRDYNDDVSNTLHDEMGYIRGLWIKFFEQIGRMAYAQAQPIVSLYEGNRLRQIADGAPADKTQVITNGINLQRYEKVLQAREPGIAPVLGLIGRVVPIKDIKTFIRAMRVLADRMPEAEGWIVGPEDEDEAYVEECKDLVRSLGLQQQVKFLGFQNVAEILPKLGLMVLTSISEALPLVLLEAFASGLPCIATDVGSCRELIEGSSEEDKALGAAGEVVAISDPEATADAAYRLLSNTAQWQAAQAAGLQRVKRYYDDQMMFASYRQLYLDTLQSAEDFSTPKAATGAD